MTNLPMMFSDYARQLRSADEPVPNVENVFFKFCSFCFEIMAHYRRDDHSECSVCGLKTYPRGGNDEG